MRTTISNNNNNNKNNNKNNNSIEQSQINSVVGRALSLRKTYFYATTSQFLPTTITSMQSLFSSYVRSYKQVGAGQRQNDSYTDSGYPIIAFFLIFNGIGSIFFLFSHDSFKSGKSSFFESINQRKLISSNTIEALNRERCNFDPNLLDFQTNIRFSYSSLSIYE